MSIRYEYLESIDSTNNEIKRRASDGLEPWTVISAGTQTAGRGRTGHSWESPKGDSISTSLFLKPILPPEAISRLTIIAGMAVASAIEKLYPLKAEIKWPNDVLVNKKKICGILSELFFIGDGEKNVVVGIGVNVHQQDFPEEIKHMATSIDLELAGKGRGSRKELTRTLWEEFERLYKAFEKSGDLSMLKPKYNDRLVSRGERVRVMDPVDPYEGICIGIDDTGALIVECDGGDIRKADAGEVSVRGIYGYV